MKRGRIGLRRHPAGTNSASGELDRGRQGLRNIGEQHRHFSADLKAMIGGELIAIGLGDQATAGDAQ